MRVTEQVQFSSDPQLALVRVLSTSERERAFRVWDLDKDGGISLNEYVLMMRGLQSVAHRFDEQKAALFDAAHARADEIARRYASEYLDYLGLLTSASKRQVPVDRGLALSLWWGLIGCPCTLGCSLLPYYLQVRLELTCL